MVDIWDKYIEDIMDIYGEDMGQVGGKERGGGGGSKTTLNCRFGSVDYTRFLAYALFLSLSLSLLEKLLWQCFLFAI